MRVRVHKVDLDARKIDFRPVVADQDKVEDKGQQSQSQQSKVNKFPGKKNTGKKRPDKR
jgi:hypothetical protein